jgi:hypothetical protein
MDADIREVARKRDAECEKALVDVASAEVEEDSPVQTKAAVTREEWKASWDYTK